MGKTTGISWCHHTFNAWRGCTKVSAGCTNCYAETLSHRNPEVLGVWGDNGTRVVGSDSYWKQPRAWNKAAAKAGERRRVFCASLADVFEDRPELVSWRRELFELIQDTPNLDWLLLTKRPQNALRMMVESGLYAVENPWLPCPQPNIWIGTSVEDQKTADERIPHLLKTPAVVRFLSVEPLLGPIDLLDCRYQDIADPSVDHRALSGKLLGGGRVQLVNWVIAGGESGPNARPMSPRWVRSIRDQCVAAGVPFFFKQWGSWIPDSDDGTHWFEDRIDGEFFELGRDFFAMNEGQLMRRTSAKTAGNVLDGRTWEQFPTTREASVP